MRTHRKWQHLAALALLLAARWAWLLSEASLSGGQLEKQPAAVGAGEAPPPPPAAGSEKLKVPPPPPASAQSKLAAMIDDRFAGSMSSGGGCQATAASEPANPLDPLSQMTRRRRHRLLPDNNNNHHHHDNNKKAAARLRRRDLVNQPPEASNQGAASARQPEAATSLTSKPEQSEPLKCRVEKDLYLDFEEYKHYSCAICYNNMAESVFVRKLSFRREWRIWLKDELTGRHVLPNETNFLLDTFKKESTANMWLYCCQQALDCCRKNWAHYLSRPGVLERASGRLVDPAERDFCPATWDGLECWPNTAAGQLVEHPCPDHVYFLSFVPVCSGSVSKQCFSNGSWFIRNNHEWSNFTNCAPLPLYETRMLIGSIWNIVSALVVGPSLLIFSKLPNRGGSKRVQILQNLLLWVLIYYLFGATHKIGVITKVFRLGTEPNDGSSSANSRLRHHQSSHFFTGTRAASQYLQTPSGGPTIVQHSPGASGDVVGPNWVRGASSRQRRGEQDASLRANMVDLDYKMQPGHHSQPPCNSRFDCAPPPPPLSNLEEEPQVPLESAVSRDALNSMIKFKTTLTEGRFERHSGPGNLEKPTDNISSTPLNSRDVPDKLPTSQHQQQQRLNSTPSNIQKHRTATRQSTFITLACWTVSLGVRITRQLGYAWMFAGAIYLCSVLHFAPAEPPPSFIRWLMILTNVIPLTIGLVYLIVRSIYEPSPLVLLFKLPYYYAINDSSTIEYLKESQTDCWMFRSAHDTIEQITEFPNLILVILNSGLFIVTLTIMCRINRPGSTRQEMSLAHYFKAAGTLVLLYGAHYTLLAGLPNVDKKRSQDPNGCIKAQIGYYAFQFVDNIQGILVSYVFCYRTQEGREVISKWWSNWSSRKECQWLKLGSSCSRSARISHDYILSSSQQDKSMSTKCIGNEKEASSMDPGTKIEVCQF